MGTTARATKQHAHRKRRCHRQHQPTRPPTPLAAALHRHRPAPTPPAPAPHHTPAARLRQLPPAMGRHHRTATPSRLARTGTRFIRPRPKRPTQKTPATHPALAQRTAATMARANPRHTQPAAHHAAARQRHPTRSHTRQHLPALPDTSANPARQPRAPHPLAHPLPTPPQL